jgi:hypothetical protein
VLVHLDHAIKYDRSELAGEVPLIAPRPDDTFLGKAASTVHRRNDSSGWIAVVLSGSDRFEPGSVRLNIPLISRKT